MRAAWLGGALVVAAGAAALHGAAEESAPFPDECRAFLRGPATRLVRVYGDYAWTHDGPIQAVAFSPSAFAGSDGENVLALSANEPGRGSQVVLRRAMDGKELARIGEGASAVLGLAVAPDGTIALARDRGTLDLVSPGTLAARRVEGLGAGFGADGVLAFSPDSKRIVATTGPRQNGEPRAEAVLLDLSADDVLRPIGRDGPLLALSFSSEGRRIVAARRGSVSVHDAASGDELRALEVDGALCACAASGELVALASPDELSLLDAASGAVRFRVAGAPRCAAFSRDGKRLAAGYTDGAVRMFSVATGEPATLREASGEEVACLAVSPDGARVAVGLGNRLRVLDAAAVVSERRSGGAVSFLSVSLDGKTIVSVRGAETTLWDAESGKSTGTLGREGAERGSPLLIGRGRLLVRGSATAVVDLETGETLATIDSTGKSEPLAVSPDGRRGAFAREGEPLTVRDLEDGRAVSRLEGTVAHRAVFSPDGERLLCSADRSVVARVASGTVIRTFEHEQRAERLALSPDGRLALLAEGGCAVLVDLLGRREAAAIDLGSSADHPCSAAFGPGGEWLVVGTARGVILRFALVSPRDATGSAWTIGEKVASPRLRGSVRDSSGRAVAGARVTVTPFSEGGGNMDSAHSHPSLEVETDGEGRYAYAPTSPGWRVEGYRIDIAAAGFLSPAPFAAIVRQEVEDEVEVEPVVLLRPASLALALADEEGKPAGGVTVRLELAAPPARQHARRRAGEARDAITDPAGRAWFSDLREGAWQVEARTEESAASTTVAVLEGEDGAARVRLDATPRGSIEGTVASPGREDLLAHVHVRSASGWQSELAASDGTFELEKLVPGTADVFVVATVIEDGEPPAARKPGEKPAEKSDDVLERVAHARVQIGAKAPSKLDAVVVPCGRIAGRVTARDLCPSSLAVWVSGPDQLAVPWSGLRRHEKTSVPVLRDGSFSIHAFPGECEVHVGAHEGVSLLERRVVVRSGETLALDLDVGPTATLATEAVFPRGDRSSGVTATVAGDGWRVSTYADDSRPFEVRGLPEGEWTVAARYPYQEGDAEPLWFACSRVRGERGKTTHATLALARTGRIAGEVRDRSGKPCPGAVLRLKGGILDGERLASADRLGRFSFAALQDGEHLLEVDPGSLLLVAARARARAASASPRRIVVARGSAPDEVVTVTTEGPAAGPGRGP